MIAIKYVGNNGALTMFAVSGATDVQLDRVKSLGGYGAGRPGSDGVVFTSNKRGYRAATEYVEAQAAIAARTAVAAPVAASAPKSRVLVPASFTDAQIVALVGNVNLDGRGAVFTINADHPCTHGDHLMGYEGSAGQYAYYTK